MAGNDTKDDDITSVNPLREDLQRLAGEIRLQLHLGGMEAKDAWNKLEPKLTRFDEMASAVTAEVAKELKVLGQELKQDLGKLRTSLTSNKGG